MDEAISREIAIPFASVTQKFFYSYDSIIKEVQQKLELNLTTALACSKVKFEIRKRVEGN